MEQKNTKYYSYISEYYAANPTKFEKRKNNLKPVLYLGLADVITLSGNDYDDNIDLIKQMFKDEEDN